MSVRTFGERLEVLVAQSLVLIGSFLYAPAPAMACKCDGGHTACGEVTAGSAVFVGRVLSVSPAFLNRFNPANRADVNPVTRFYNQLDSGVPEVPVEDLKKTFRSLISGLAPEIAQRLDDAKSRAELLKTFDLVLRRGTYVTLEVRSVFTQGRESDDDQATGARSTARQSTTDKAKDKDKDNDDADDDLAPGKLIGLWTPSFDCGVEFQTGETYLVYASQDEDSETIETDTCMVTRRLSDAGADLPYLTFVKNDPKEAGHLDGFVTSDPKARANPPESDSIPSPRPGVLIELKSDDSLHYTTSDQQGRFTFDGLAKDRYEVRGYSSDRPDPETLISGPDEITVDPKACRRYVGLVRQAR